MIRLFVGLTNYPVGTLSPLIPAPSAPIRPACTHYASLQASGYRDTYIEDYSEAECVRLLVVSHRAAVRCRRAERRRMAS